MASSSTNWLFSLASPVEFVSSDQLLFDNFYENGWSEKSQEFHIPGQQENQASDLHVQIQYENNNKNNSSMMLNNLINIEENQDIPQLEGFLGGANSTHETPIYDINGLTGFRGFSLSPGVDGSGSIGKSQLGTELAGQSNEPSMTQFNCPTGVVANKKTSKKAVETDCTKVADHTYCHRSSIYRGVTRHRWTGRYEAHLWDNSIKQKRRNGRQVYLGGYDKEDKAARAYDMGALKYWGAHAKTNFPASDYLQQMEEMKHLTRLEFIAAIRRKSCGFSRGASVYRGVTRHHQQGRWQARIGRVSGNRDMYLGTFLTEEEAAEAYDVAAIKFRGINAVTNFEMSCYDVEAIMKCPLPVGGAKRQKISLESEQNPPVDNGQQLQPTRRNDNVNFLSVQPITTIPHGISYNDANIYGQNTFPPVLSNNIIDTPNASRLNHAYRNSNANAQDAAVSDFSCGLIRLTMSEYCKIQNTIRQSFFAS